MDLKQLFLHDPLPPGALPIYDTDMGSDIIVLDEHNNPEHLKASHRLETFLREMPIYNHHILNCLDLTARLLKQDSSKYRYDDVPYKTLITGNEAMTDPRATERFYIKGFKHSILLPKPEYLGVICSKGHALGLWFHINNTCVLN